MHRDLGGLNKLGLLRCFVLLERSDFFALHLRQLIVTSTVSTPSLSILFLLSLGLARALSFCLSLSLSLFLSHTHTLSDLQLDTGVP